VNTRFYDHRLLALSFFLVLNNMSSFMINSSAAVSQDNWQQQELQKATYVFMFLGD